MAMMTRRRLGVAGIGFLGSIVKAETEHSVMLPPSDTRVDNKEFSGH
jgi:hypothetical protein